MLGVGAKCHIVCVGDSLTLGGPLDSYPRTLKDMLVQRQPNCTWTVTALGKNGASTTDWVQLYLSNPSHKASFASADVFLVMIGTNDCQLSPGFNETVFSNNLKQIVESLASESPGASVCLATTPPVLPGGSFTQYFDHVLVNNTLPRLIPQIAHSLGVRCVDCFSLLGGAAPNRQAFNADGVHLLAEGNAVIASAMADFAIQCTDGMSGSFSQPGATAGGSVGVQPLLATTSAGQHQSQKNYQATTACILNPSQNLQAATVQATTPVTQNQGPYQVNDVTSASQTYAAITSAWNTNFNLADYSTIEAQNQCQSFHGTSAPQMHAALTSALNGTSASQTYAAITSAQNASFNFPTSSTIEAQSQCQSYQLNDWTSASQTYAPLLSAQNGTSASQTYAAMTSAQNANFPTSSTFEAQNQSQVYQVKDGTSALQTYAAIQNAWIANGGSYST